MLQNIHIYEEFASLMESRKQAKQYLADKKITQDLYDALEALDPSETKKYMGAMAKWMIDGSANLEDLEIIKTYDALARKKLLAPEHRDIAAFKTFTMFRSAVNQYSDVVTKADIKRKEKQGAEIILEDDRWFIVKPNTYESVCVYGAHTKWCITTKDKPDYFEKLYATSTFYFVMDKTKKEDDPMHKVAVQIPKLKDGSQGHPEVWDSEDHPLVFMGSDEYMDFEDWSVNYGDNYAYDDMDEVQDGYDRDMDARFHDPRNHFEYWEFSEYLNETGLDAQIFKYTEVDEKQSPRRAVYSKMAALGFGPTGGEVVEKDGEYGIMLKDESLDITDKDAALKMKGVRFFNIVDLMIGGVQAMSDLTTLPRKIAGSLDLRFAIPMSVKKFTMDGCPEVGVSLSVRMPQLDTLEGCLQKIPGSFTLTGNPSSQRSLKTLEGGPKEVGASFTLRDLSVADLTGMPEAIGGYVIIERLDKLTSFKGLDALTTTRDNTLMIDVSNSKVKSFEGWPEKMVCEKIDIRLPKNMETLEHLPHEIDAQEVILRLAEGQPLGVLSTIPKLTLTGALDIRGLGLSDEKREAMSAAIMAHVKVGSLLLDGKTYKGS
jgi:hypothetical protein